MAIAGDHLRAGGVGRQAEALAGETFDFGVGVGISPHGAAHLAHGHIALQPLEPFGIASGFSQPASQLEAKGDRLAMNGMGAADHHRGFVLRSQLGDGSIQCRQLLAQQGHRGLQLKCNTRVQHITAGHAHMDVAPSIPHVFIHVGQESDHVVTHFRFDFQDPLGFESRFAADVGHRRFGNASQAAVGFTGSHFDIEPALVLGPVGPDLAHFGQGVALDQGIAVERSIHDHTVTQVR